MKRYKKLSLLIGAVVFFLIIIPGITHLLLEAQAEAIIVQEVNDKIKSAENYTENVIRVQFKDNAPQDKIEKLTGKRNIPAIFKGTPYEKVEYIEIQAEDMLEQMVEYSKNALVESVDVDPIFTTTSWTPDGENRALPIDWNATNHWYFNKIKLPEVWKKQGCLESTQSCGGKNDIVVAVIDTGLGLNDYTANFEYNGTTYESINFSKAPEMEGINLWTNPDGTNANNGFCNDLNGVDIAIAYENRNRYVGENPCDSDQFYKEGQPNDDNGHGTFVSGIIASATNNTSGTSLSMAHNIRILTIKANNAFERTFSGRSVEEGIYYATEYADVINMSLGSTSSTTFIETAINYAVSQGIVVVAASGNENTSVSYPAAHSNVIAVGAINNNNTKSSYSNYGAELDFVVPVGDGPSPSNVMWHQSLSCSPTCSQSSNFTEYSHQYGIGTSYASPQVAAAAALIKGLDSTLTPAEIKDILIYTVDDIAPAGKDNETGYGALNLLNIYNSFHNLEYIAGENGSIAGEALQNVWTGNDGTQVTATPNTGYHFTE
jgi:hypothetical protein